MAGQKGYHRNRTIYTLLLIICILGFWWFENFYTPDTYSDPEGTERATVADYLLPSNTGQVVQHQHFMLSYSERYEQAEWVAYTLKKEQLTYDDRDRPYFIEDPKVKTKSADWRNYKGSGYDRGHLCPAGDRRFSEYAYNETFYTSNISPQDREFNAGLWNRLEQQVRRWAKRYGQVVVLTGGVLEQGLDHIGEEEVAVPRQFYKIVVRGSQPGMQVLAFLMEAKESNRPLTDFLVPVDRIEARTGLDFFQGLPDTLQNSVEASVNASSWGL